MSRTASLHMLKIAAASLLIFGSTLVAPPTQLNADWTFLRGDANDDGGVDVADVIAGLDYLFGGPGTTCVDALDTNDDGNVDLSDPIFTLIYLFGGGAPLGDPFTMCGSDPTPDALDCVGPLATCPDSAPPNIVLIVADDMGVDMVGVYGEASAPPCTPNLDQLAAQGMLFRNAWATPICSPTRAAIQTGRYGFRTGIGTAIMGEPGLATSETTLLEVLPGYSSSCVGKWHISGNLGGNHPFACGFDNFIGTLQGGIPDYLAWTKVTNGQPAPVTNYATSETTDDAIDAVLNLAPPFFVQVSYHAPHSPHHIPPAALCPPGCPTGPCNSPAAMPTTAEYVKGMVEALDTEIGRLLQTIDLLPNTWVFFMGDNGTARMAAQPPFINSHGKASVYEGGVNVPFIVRGPGVPVAECAGLVCCTDLFSTFTELAGMPAFADDSVSMVPYFSDPTTSVRSTMYAEIFTPNHQPMLPFVDHARAVRNDRYKVIRRTGDPDEFYDLLNDPFETNDLMAPMGPPLNATQLAAYNDLVAEFVALGVN